MCTCTRDSLWMHPQGWKGILGSGERTDRGWLSHASWCQCCKNCVESVRSVACIELSTVGFPSVVEQGWPCSCTLGEVQVLVLEGGAWRGAGLGCQSQRELRVLGPEVIWPSSIMFALHYLRNRHPTHTLGVLGPSHAASQSLACSSGLGWWSLAPRSSQRNWEAPSRLFFVLCWLLALALLLLVLKLQSIHCVLQGRSLEQNKPKKSTLSGYVGAIMGLK